jgi:hypothetical protein
MVPILSTPLLSCSFLGASWEPPGAYIPSTAMVGGTLPFVTFTRTVIVQYHSRTAITSTDSTWYEYVVQTVLLDLLEKLKLRDA